MWCGEVALKEALFDLYRIACVKDAYVAVHLDLSSGSLQWMSWLHYSICCILIE